MKNLILDNEEDVNDQATENTKNESVVGEQTQEKKTQSRKSESEKRSISITDEVKEIIQKDLHLFPECDFLISTKDKIPKEYSYIDSWNDAFFNNNLKERDNFKPIDDRERLILDGTVDLTDIPRGIIIIMGDPHTGKSSVDIKLTKYLVDQAKNGTNSWHIPFLEPMSDIKKIMSTAPFKRLSHKDPSLPVVSIDSITSHIYNLNKSHVAMSGGINLSAIKEKLAIFDIYADKKDCFIVLTVNTLGMDERIKEAILTASKSISVLTLDLNRSMINYRTTNMRDRFEGRWSKIDVVSKTGEVRDTIYSTMIDFTIANKKSGTSSDSSLSSITRERQPFRFIQSNDSDSYDNLNIRTKDLSDGSIANPEELSRRIIPKSGSTMPPLVQKMVNLINDQNSSVDEFFLIAKNFVRDLMNEDYSIGRLYSESKDYDEYVDSLIVNNPTRGPNSAINIHLFQMMLNFMDLDSNEISDYVDLLNNESTTFSDFVDYLSINNKKELAELDLIMTDPE